MKNYFILGIFSLGMILSCQNIIQKKYEQVAKAQCGACHLPPSPSSLSKDIWQNSILPEMAKYYVWSEKSVYAYANEMFYSKKGSLPMNDKTWSAIESYYLENSPLEIAIRPFENLSTQTYFEELPFSNICQLPAVTALHIDEKGQLLCACNKKLLAVNIDATKNTLWNSPFILSHIEPLDDEQILLLNIGELGPHNYAKGSLLLWNTSRQKEEVLLKNLHRPVYINRMEDQLLISEHGHDVGKLSVYHPQTTAYEQLLNLSGSYKSYWVDINKNGKEELLVQFSQAKEGIYTFSIAEDSTYSTKTLLTFPPNFGFSDLDTADINQDGWVDLVVSNGDNADISNIPKNYHGVRVYLNDRTGNFKESYFYPLYGATQVSCLDIQGDGKVDIVVASFFAEKVEESIRVLTNQSTEQLSFSVSSVASAPKGRWMVMQTGDLDKDGDLDVVLGSFINGPTKMKDSILDNWLKESVDLLVLLNEQK